jgi:hypothetical protein
MRVAQSGTGMIRYWTEKLDAGIPMPAASVSMPIMPASHNKLAVLLASLLLLV